jgi:hypothetical protein
MCEDCSRVGDGRTTLDSQLDEKYDREVWLKLNVKERQYAEVTGLRGRDAKTIRAKLTNDANATDVSETWGRWQAFLRAAKHPDLTHAFVRSTGSVWQGPRDETCEVCGKDPRNLVHAQQVVDQSSARLHVGDKSVPVEVIGRSADGKTVTMKVTDQDTIDKLKAGTEPVSVGYTVKDDLATPPDRPAVKRVCVRAGCFHPQDEHTEGDGCTRVIYIGSASGGSGMMVDEGTRETCKCTAFVSTRETLTAGPPPDGRSVAEHLDELMASRLDREEYLFAQANGILLTDHAEIRKRFANANVGSADHARYKLYKEGTRPLTQEMPPRHMMSSNVGVLRKPDDKLADAYRELKESMEHLDDAIFGWSEEPGARLTDDKLKEARHRCCKAVLADAMYLLERIKNT